MQLWISRQREILKFPGYFLNGETYEFFSQEFISLFFFKEEEINETAGRIILSAIG